MNSIEKLSFLQKALSSLKDTFDILLKADAPKKKEFKDWSPSRYGGFAPEHVDNIKNAMDTHGFNLREAAVHSGAETTPPKNTKFTPFSENWLKHAKEHAANKNAEFEAIRLSEAKPEENPLVSTQHVSQQLSAQHGQNYGTALKEFLNKPEHAALSPEQKKQKIHEFKKDFHIAGKGNLNNEVKQISSHEANALADFHSNKEGIITNIASGGAGVDIPEGETRSVIATKKKVSPNNPLSEQGVVDYLHHNAGQEASALTHQGLAREGKIGKNDFGERERIDLDHSKELSQGLWQALHSYDPNSGNFASYASGKIQDLIRRKKKKEQGFMPASLDQELKTLESDKESEVVHDKGAYTGAEERAKVGIEAKGGEEGDEDTSSISTRLTPDARRARRIARAKLLALLDKQSSKTKAAKARAKKINDSLSPETHQKIKHLDTERSNIPGIEKPFETPDHLYDAPAGESHSFGDLIDYARDDFDKKRGANPTGKIDPQRVKDLVSKFDPLDLERAPDDFIKLVHQHAPKELEQHEGFKRLSPKIQNELKGNK
jgi:hypothetical protein